MSQAVTVTGPEGTYEVPEAYEGLLRVLMNAFDQAASGKGKDRHCIGAEYFEDQVCCEGARRFGPGAPMFQAWKKTDEAMRMEPEAAIHELRGAINYNAAAIIILEEQIEERAAQSESDTCSCDFGCDECEEVMTVSDVTVAGEEVILTLDPDATLSSELDVEVELEDENLTTVDVSNMEPGETFKFNLEDLKGGDPGIVNLKLIL